MAEPDVRTRILRTYSDLIDKHGWALVGVSGEAAEPPFCYTVGLTGLGYPELLMVGLPQQAAGSILNDVARAVMEGQGPGHGSEMSGFLEHGVPLRFVSVGADAARPWVAVARALYEMPYQPVEVVQVVWPHSDGAWPWEKPAPGQPVLADWPG